MLPHQSVAVPPTNQLGALQFIGGGGATIYWRGDAASCGLAGRNRGHGGGTKIYSSSTRSPSLLGALCCLIVAFEGLRQRKSGG